MIERNIVRFGRMMASLALAFMLLLAWANRSPAYEPDFSAIDKNENGVIEPTEIPTQDLAVIARYASLAGLDISDPMPIAALKTGREKYFHNLDGGGTELQLAGKQQFGRVSGTTVRPFGTLGSYIDTYTPGVRKGTIATFQKYDANRDGLLTEEELSVTYRYYGQLWMRGDRDGNGVLTFAELANSIAADRERRNGSRAREQETWNVDGVEITPEHRQYAARWMTREDKNKNGRLESGEIPQDWKTGDFLKWADQNEDGQISRTEMQIGAAHWVRDKELAQPLKSDPNMQHCAVLAADLIRRFDVDKDRALRRAEWQRIGGDISSGDVNGNGLIVEAELSKWLLSSISSQAGADLTEDMPNWFVESDADLDAQVTIAEFVAAQSHNRLSEFQYQDRNSDGIVTPAELSRHGTAGKTRYVSGGQRVLEAKQVVYSEIFIPEEITIADIDVQVSIIKDGDDDLDVRLVGPDGTTAVLYYTSSRKAWGGGRIFNDTIIDDEAPHSPQRLPRPPSHRSFRPQSMGNKELLSLSAFYGKSAQGRWRLVVGNKAQNKGRGAGLLEGWALFVKPSGPASQRSAPQRPAPQRPAPQRPANGL